MAGVLTDQSISGSLVAPLALTTNASQFQFLNNGKFGRTGNATVPIPGTGRSTKRRVRLSVLANVTTSVANSLTINILIDGVVYATSGAKTVNAKSGTAYFYTEFVYDPAAANLTGQLGGYVDNSIIAVAPLTNTTNIAFNNEGHLFGVSASVANADAGAVLSLDELVVKIF